MWICVIAAILYWQPIFAKDTSNFNVFGSYAAAILLGFFVMPWMWPVILIRVILAAYNKRNRELETFRRNQS